MPDTNDNVAAQNQAAATSPDPTTAGTPDPNSGSAEPAANADVGAPAPQAVGTINPDTAEEKVVHMPEGSTATPLKKDTEKEARHLIQEALATSLAAMGRAGHLAKDEIEKLAGDAWAAIKKI